LSCYERNWGTYNLIHKIMKSKTRPEWADDLVFVHTNLRLLSRTKADYYTDPKSMLWDVEGDCFVASFVTGVLEFATLSIDEPEFELAMMEEAERVTMMTWRSRKLSGMPEALVSSSR
jgi:hypothetical protein